MAIVFADQIPALRTGLQECNLAAKLGLTNTAIAAADTNAGLVAAVKAIPGLFGDQFYLRDVIIPGSIRMEKTIGVLTDAAILADATIADLQADFTALDANIPDATAYGIRNWDSN